MSLFEFRTGSAELLVDCHPLWELFISSQTKNAGVMSMGVEAYLRSLRDDGLRRKTQDGKLQVQLVLTADEPIGFCITSLTKERIGEVETLFVRERYRGNKLGSKLFENALTWMKERDAIEQRLVVATGNEELFNFYGKYEFLLGYSTLFRSS
jgi:diamine N-acetyltransferase